MVLCPVARAVGCRKCPVFAICPLKSTIGDYVPPAVLSPQAADGEPIAKRTKKPARGRSGAVPEPKRRTPRRPSR